MRGCNIHVSGYSLINYFQYLTLQQCVSLLLCPSVSESSTDYSDHAPRQTLIKEKTLLFIAGILMALSVVIVKKSEV